jgi:glutaredoxin/glutathione-dependent peroxiredoxin
MVIKVGEKLPDATVTESTEFGEACPVAPVKLSVAEQAKGKRIVVFGLPGAYTPTCSGKHLPGYVQNLEALRAKGIDEVWCVAVNDGFVMAAWGREHGAMGRVRMFGDGDAEFTRKLGLDTQIPGMGTRSRRYSLLVEDGVIRRVNVEEPGKFVVSNVEVMLEQVGG